MIRVTVAGVWIGLIASAAFCITRAKHDRPADLPAPPAPGVANLPASGTQAPQQSRLREPEQASPNPSAVSHPQVRTVPHHTDERTTYDVVCSACGILATRTLAEAADEEARWHRARGWHHAMFTARAPHPRPGSTPPHPTAATENP